LGKGAEFVVRGGFENQFWFGAGAYFDEPPVEGQFNPLNRFDSHDVAFMGFVFQAMVER
jgi:hypothetical protein